MSVLRADLHRAHIDGVPVYWMDAPPPFRAGLLFRVGRSDETLATSGQTHLVEHLALFEIGRTSFYANGLVDDTHTAFYAEGTEEEVTGFLAAVASALGRLPLERLETEKRILETEAAGAPADTYSRLSMLRFGARAHGLGYFQELGLKRLEARDVETWSRERFTRQNAAVWMTGPPPADLSFQLPDGVRQPTVEARSLTGLTFPAQIAEGTGGVSLSAVGTRSSALSTGLGIAARRAHDRLRLEGGLSYWVGGSYQPLSAERVHYLLGADCLDEHAVAVRDGILDTLRELAEAGPTEEELEEARSEFARRTDDPNYARNQLDYSAREELFSGHVLTPQELLELVEGLSPSEVAEVIAPTFESLIVLAPERTPMPAGFVQCEPSSSEPVHGRVFRSQKGRFGKQTKVVVGDEAVTYRPVDSEAVTIRFQDCVGLLRWDEARLTLLGLDGSWMDLTAPAYRNGEELLGLIEGRVPAGTVIPYSDVQDARSLALLAHEKELPDVSGTLERLYAHLIPGERVLNLAYAGARINSAGILALTDRRLLYVFVAKFGRTKDVHEYPLDAITSVKGRWAWVPWLLENVVFIADGKKVAFGWFHRRRSAVELWRALREHVSTG